MSNSIIIAGVDSTGLLSKIFYKSFKPRSKDATWIWDYTFEIDDYSFNVKNIKIKKDIKTNPALFLGLTEEEIDTFKSADIIILSVNNDCLNTIGEVSFCWDNAKLVVLVCSDKNVLVCSNPDGIKNFCKLDFDKIFPNAVVVGLCPHDEKMALKKIITAVTNPDLAEFLIVNTKNICNDNYDTSAVWENTHLSSLMAVASCYQYFIYHNDSKDYPLSTYNLAEYKAFTMCLNNVGDLWLHHSNIPYVCGKYEVSDDDAKDIKAAVNNAKTYNGYVCITSLQTSDNICKNYIQGKIHYSLIDKYQEKKRCNFEKKYYDEKHIGVDCSGFVTPFLHESISQYKNSIDLNTDHTDPNTSLLAYNRMKRLNGYKDFWGLNTHDATIVKEKGSIIVPTIEQVRPGDIMRTVEDSNVNGIRFHIRVVSKVEHISSDNETNKIRIYTIESSSANQNNGIVKKIYEFEKTNESYNLTVYQVNDNKETKMDGEFKLIRNPVVSIIGYWFDNKIICQKQEMICNKSVIIKSEEEKGLSRENSGEGFDHVVEPLLTKFPLRSYYFRRPKYIQALMNLADVAPLDYKESISGIVEDFIIDEETFKIVEYSMNELLSEYNNVFGEIDNFTQKYKEDLNSINNIALKFLDTFYNYKDELDLFQKTVESYKENKNNVESKVFNEVKNYLKQNQSNITVDKLKAIIHKSIFKVEYDKESLKLANTYLHTFLYIKGMCDYQKSLQQQFEQCNEKTPSYYGFDKDTNYELWLQTTLSEMKKELAVSLGYDEVRYALQYIELKNKSKIVELAENNGWEEVDSAKFFLFNLLTDKEKIIEIAKYLGWDESLCAFWYIHFSEEDINCVEDSNMVKCAKDNGWEETEDALEYIDSYTQNEILNCAKNFGWNKQKEAYQFLIENENQKSKDIIINQATELGWNSLNSSSDYIEQEINKLAVYADNYKKYRNVASIYCLKAYNFDFAHFLDKEDEYFEIANKEAEIAKLVLSVLVGVLTGGLAGECLLAQMAIDASVTLAMDLYDKSNNGFTSEELKETTIDTILAAAVTFGVGGISRSFKILNKIPQQDLSISVFWKHSYNDFVNDIKSIKEFNKNVLFLPIKKIKLRRANNYLYFHKIKSEKLNSIKTENINKLNEGIRENVSLIEGGGSFNNNQEILEALKKEKTKLVGEVGNFELKLKKLKETANNIVDIEDIDDILKFFDLKDDLKEITILKNKLKKVENAISETEASIKEIEFLEKNDCEKLIETEMIEEKIFKRFSELEQITNTTNKETYTRKQELMKNLRLHDKWVIKTNGKPNLYFSEHPEEFIKYVTDNNGIIVAYNNYLTAIDNEIKSSWNKWNEIIHIDVMTNFGYATIENLTILKIKALTADKSISELIEEKLEKEDKLKEEIKKSDFSKITNATRETLPLILMKHPFISYNDNSFEITNHTDAMDELMANIDGFENYSYYTHAYYTDLVSIANELKISMDDKLLIWKLAKMKMYNKKIKTSSNFSKYEDEYENYDDIMESLKNRENYMEKLKTITLIKHPFITREREKITQEQEKKVYKIIDYSDELAEFMRLIKGFENYSSSIHSFYSEVITYVVNNTDHVDNSLDDKFDRIWANKIIEYKNQMDKDQISCSLEQNDIYNEFDKNFKEAQIIINGSVW